MHSLVLVHSTASYSELQNDSEGVEVGLTGVKEKTSDDDEPAPAPVSGSGPGGSGVGGGSGSSSSPYDQGDQQTITASSAAVGALEAALFRPALNSALRDAARWKGKALTQSLMQLPPLSVPVIFCRVTNKRNIGENRKKMVILIVITMTLP